MARTAPRNPRKAPAKKKAQPRLRSGFEAKCKKCLDENKAQYEYESDKIPYTVPTTIKNYIPDFKVTTRTGKTIFIEAKGRWLAQDYQKLKMVKQQNPEIDLRMVFMRDNPIRKGSQTTYSKRAAKLGIPFVVSSSGNIPLSWLQE
jgi:hypothetical protein